MLSPTDLCILHDRILERHDYSHPEALRLLLDLATYEPMLLTQPDSNIKVRQRLIQGGLSRVVGLNTDPLSSGLAIFDRLRRNLTWAEGPSYFEYTVSAFEWLWRVLGQVNPEVQRIVNAVSANYDDLVAPDGTIPLPEARETVYAKRRRPDFVETPSHICIRWPSGAYLLVCVDPVMEPRENLHVAPTCGYFALWAAGGWRVRCNPYTGFDLRKAVDSDGLLALLPPGAVDPTWRIMGVECKVKWPENGVSFRWRRPWFDCLRTITWSATGVRVVDRWMGVKKSVREWMV